jgi:hypothetical protein
LAGELLKISHDIVVMKVADWCIASCEAHVDFADESVCLMANMVWN